MKTDIWLQNPKDDGTSQAAKLFKNKYTIINESTVRTFVKKYDQNVKVAKAGGRSPVKKIQKFNMKETSNGWACHWRKKTCESSRFRFIKKDAMLAILSLQQPQLCY